MGVYLRQLYKQKPQAWGPHSAVQSALFYNADRMGIDPESIALAMPMWNPGDQRDYSKNGLVGVNNGAIHKDDYLLLDGGDVTITDTETRTFFDNAFTFNFDVYTHPSGDSSSPDIIYAYNGYSNGWYIEQWRYNDLIIKFQSIVSYSFSSLSIVYPSSGFNNFTLVHDGSSTLTGYVNGGYVNSGTVALPPNPNLTQILKSTGDKIKHYELFSSALTYSQIAQLSDNPYALWQPRTPTYFSLPDTGGGSTLLPKKLNGGLINNSLTVPRLIA